MRPLHTNRVRRFIEAVYSYVNKYRPGVKLTVVAHSLGNTVTRGAMRDGNLYSKVETFVSIAGGNNGLLTCGTYVLMYGVWTYLPYAGAIAPTCSKATGFALPVPYYILYGVAYGAPDMSSLSLNNNLVATNSYNMWFNPLGYWNTSALVDTSYWMGALNNADRQFKYGTSTATRAYVILSEVDEINGIKASGLYGQRWWGPRLAGAYGTAKYTSAPYGHFGLKSRTTAVQKNMILRTYGSGDRTNPTY
jgi:hypothetical protein